MSQLAAKGTIDLMIWETLPSGMGHLLLSRLENNIKYIFHYNNLSYLIKIIFYMISKF